MQRGIFDLQQTKVLIKGTSTTSWGDETRLTSKQFSESDSLRLNQMGHLCSFAEIYSNPYLMTKKEVKIEGWKEPKKGLEIEKKLLRDTSVIFIIARFNGKGNESFALNTFNISHVLSVYVILFLPASFLFNQKFDHEDK